MTSLYVTEAGAFIKRKGGHVIVGRNNEVLFEVPLERIEDISVIDSVHISSTLITEFLERGIPVTWLAGYGQYFGTLISTKTIDILKHRTQFDLLNDKSFYLELSRKILRAKINNQLTVLRRYSRNVEEGLIESQIKNIISLRKHLNTAMTTEELMGYEGYISRVYFEAIGKLVPEEFTFSKRTKQPPRDPFNAMLGLGYSMLFNEILANVVNLGLHPFVGCLHSISKGHPALVSDLIEEWRAPLIDSMVLSLVKRNSIDLSYFDNSERGCFLNPEGRKLFLVAYNKKLRSENQYIEDASTYRESIKKQCKSYSLTIMSHDLDRYSPIVIY